MRRWISGMMTMILFFTAMPISLVHAEEEPLVIEEQLEEVETEEKETEVESYYFDDTEEESLFENEEALFEDYDTEESEGSEVAEEEFIEAETPQIALLSLEDATYTDSYGNIYSYSLNDSEEATITSITVTGAAVTIPSEVNGYTVIGVGTNAGECVVSNPSTRIESLSVDCATIGKGAFRGLEIGNLTIGENVRNFGYTSAGLDSYFLNFASCSIGTIYYNARNAQTHVSNNSQASVFMDATISNIEFGGQVEVIPNSLFKDCILTTQELYVDVPVLGQSAFYSGKSSIGQLTLGEHVSTFQHKTVGGNHYYMQFSGLQIEKLLYLAIDAKGDNDDAAQGIFSSATIGALEIGNQVEAIPCHFLRNAFFSTDELVLHVQYVGCYAFYGSNISIGTLVLGEEITKFDYDTTGSTFYYHQFGSTTIDKVIFESVDIAMSTSTYMYGPFYNATIGNLEMGASVKRIPCYCFNGASMQLEVLEITANSIGSHAFYSENISIGHLILGEPITAFEYSSFGANHNYMQFTSCTIGKLTYAATSATVGSSVYNSVFYNTAIGELEISANVQRLPEYLFYEAKISMDALTIDVPIIGYYAMASYDIHIGDLTIGENVTTFETNSNAKNYAFAMSDIKRLHYNATNSQLDKLSNSIYGPFSDTTTFEAIDFGENVTTIPSACFRGTKFHIAELELDHISIGYMAFNSNYITIDKLTLGENVTCTAPYSNTMYCFGFTNIGELNYGITAIKGNWSTSTNAKGMFVGAHVGHLSFSKNVTAIPMAMFADMYLEQDELEIAYMVFYGAFNSANIHVKKLMLAKEMEWGNYLSSGTLYFGNGTYDEVIYDVPLENMNYTITSSSGVGLFAYATIHKLTIGENCDEVAAYAFRNAYMDLDYLELPGNFGLYAFAGNNIKIKELVLNGDYSLFHYSGYTNNGFNGATIETVYYNVPNAVYNSSSSSTYGPFHYATITNFIVGENVRYLDDRLFRGDSFKNCYVYAVETSDAFDKQTLSNTYLPTSENLYIHYNSKFKNYFSGNAKNVNWLCEDYIDTSYGNKVFDEELQKDVMEIYRTCSVCGYEEVSIEELDESYELYLSIPVGFPLTFDKESKSYTGSQEVYLYGRLGNAYCRATVAIDNESDEYGYARKEEQRIDIREFLSASFAEGAAVFSSNDILSNADAEEPKKKTLSVAISGIAFLEHGAGDYQIPIPLKIKID